MSARLGPDDDKYVIEDDRYFRIRTRRDGTESKHLVAGFTVWPKWECLVYADRDAPSNPQRTLTVQYVWRGVCGGEQGALQEIAAPAGADFGRLLARHVPDMLAHLSVRSTKELASAIAALTAFTFVRFERYRQTGWRADGTFAFPVVDADINEDTELRHLLAAAGGSLLGVPIKADVQRSTRGGRTLHRIAEAASVATAATVIGTILAAPIFRREDQLDARGFTTVLVAPTGAGKTTYASRVYSLLGRFDRLPHALEVWSSTSTALESVGHGMRDLPVLIDDYRDLDGTSRETFRKIVMAVGNSASRGRAHVVRAGELEVAARSSPRCLVLATAETVPEGDAGEAARLLVVTADRIDVSSLLQISDESFEDLPHLFRHFVEWCGRQNDAFWRAARDERAAVAIRLAPDARGRVVENLSTVVAALLVFGTFVRQELADVDDVHHLWADWTARVLEELPSLARAQATRIAEETLDGLFLSELARGIRAGEILMPHTAQAAWRPHGPPLVGYYDGHYLYIRTEIATDWVSRRLQTGRRRKTPLTAKALVQALRGRGGMTGQRTQRTIGSTREKFRLVERGHLGDSWDGLIGDLQSGRPDDMLS